MTRGAMSTGGLEDDGAEVDGGKQGYVQQVREDCV